MKILFVDNKERLEDYHWTQLRLERIWDFEPSTFEIDNGADVKAIENISRVINAIKEVDVVLIHFGSIPRGVASKTLARIKKETDTRVIVNSASEILFEEADAVIQVPFFADRLVDIISGFFN